MECFVPRASVPAGASLAGGVVGPHHAIARAQVGRAASTRQKVRRAMKRRIGDRRSRARFEIVGDLWGSLDANATLTVRNLGSHGALIESPVALAPDSMHWVTAVIDGHAEPLRVLVRHSVRNESGRTPRYLSGVEFVSVTAATEAFIRRQLGQPQGPQGPRPDGV
jgi:hypothetical protein